MIIIEELESLLCERIAHLRTAKGVSARDMSLTMGQGAGYINSIESKKAMPSMRGFFYICEYFNISPKDFFDVDSAVPELLNEIVEDMKALSVEQFSSIAHIVKGLKNLGVVTK